MNFPFYIARRIASSSTGGYSGNIIKLAIVSVSISIAVMILSTAIIFGFKSEISEKIFGFWGNIHITDTRINRSFEMAPLLDSQEIKDSIASIGSLSYVSVDRQGRRTTHKTRGGVRSITPFITLPGIINRKGSLDGIIFKGVNEAYNWTDFEKYLLKGHFPSLADSVESRELLISEQTANRLRLDVDDKVVLHFVQDRNSIKKSMKVGGIYKTGLEIYDKRFAFLDMKILQDVMGWGDNQIGGYEIFLDEMDDAFAIADYVYETVLPPHLYAETIQEKFSTEFDWLELQDINESLLILLMLIVAIINMSTAILILILERSRMIGILKALGQKDWGIRKIFVYNAVWIMSLAIIFGNIIGIGLAWFQKQTGFLKLNEENYYLSEVPIRFDLVSIIAINAGAVIIVALVIILPTYLVTKVTPIKILRFD
ncbi:MAG: ABC transporter permease [Saprospiraceae bacterium]|nr:ABC transporter permease [Saprospiraceae bacterium]